MDSLCKEIQSTIKDLIEHVQEMKRLLRQDDRLVSSYALNIKMLFCGTTYQEDYMVNQFRSGLNPEVKHLLLSMPQENTLEDVINQAIQCENQLLKEIEVQESEVLNNEDTTPQESEPRIFEAQKVITNDMEYACYEDIKKVKDKEEFMFDQGGVLTQHSSSKILETPQHSTRSSKDLSHEEPKEAQGRSSPSPPFKIKDHEEFEVNHVLDSRISRGRLECLFHWKAYNISDRTCELTENLQRAKVKVRELHRKNPMKPKLKNIVAPRGTRRLRGR
ncbi:hypothetical protein KP509_1Z109500 [Ceratopteris richardii]|nr:hypothetical protein KP509_1Z109500 [Ceratopteris richardii]